ncbi:hypothetical protein BKA01_007108 [Pseudonocardia eucalypti]|nr:hypothetical protein [Pseudonocardia eucalypti]
MSIMVLVLVALILMKLVWHDLMDDPFDPRLL